ncbi:unnamed protein product [Alopecurus aequalis]
MEGSADAALAAWASVRGFFTPATLFLVVNLVIGTIALTSRSRRRGGNAHDEHGDQAQGQHNQEPPFHQAQHQQENHYYDQHEQQQYVPPPPAPAPLARTSSVMDRLRSIGLYRFRSGDFPPEYATPVGTDSRDATSAPAPVDGHAQYSRAVRSDPAPAPAPPRAEIRRPSRMMKSSSSEPRTAEVPRAPAARVVRSAMLEDEEDDVLHYARAEHQRPPLQHEEDDVLHYASADEFTGGNSFVQQQHDEEEEEEEEEEEHYYREEYVPPLRLARAPSVLERLRSFSLSRFRSGDIAADDAAAAVAELERNQAQKQQYSRSRSEPSREQSTKGKKQQQETAEAKMSKSGSVARKPAPSPAVSPAEAVAEEGGVDARADDFINSFRKQLQLQRLNSLLNYKDMLNRGA